MKRTLIVKVDNANSSVASFFFLAKYLLYFLDLARRAPGTWNVIFITASMINAQVILIQIFENNFFN